MTELHSTTEAGRSKPAKPYPEFPLYAHAAGYWAKKIRGHFHYFGKWDDPDGALAKYEAKKGDLHAGRKPRPDQEAVTVKYLVNAFLNHKLSRVNTGELSSRMFADYKQAADLTVAHFGKARLVTDLAPEDFAALRNKMAKRWGPVRLKNTIQRIRSVFKFGYDDGMLDRPMRFGAGFARPSRKTLRLERAKKGRRMFEAHEILALLEGALAVGKNGPRLVKASPTIKAMILLGCNCALGNHDVGTLPMSALDLECGWINFPRPKTGIGRRCPLWPETVAAIKEALAQRPQHKDPADAPLVFLTTKGMGWSKKAGMLRTEGQKKGATKPPSNPLSGEIRKMLAALSVKGNKSFYALRHVFETIGGEAKDQVAVDAIMGHAPGDDDMASVYREAVSDERLKAVVEHVRKWLFASAKE